MTSITAALSIPRKFFRTFNMKAFVIIDGERINIDDVQVTDICEDISGRDLVTFIYEGKQYQSFVLSN